MGHTGDIAVSDQPDPLAPDDPTGGLGPLGWDEGWAALAAGATERTERTDARPGRVIRHDGLTVTVAGDEVTEALPVLATVDPPPVVGDWVLVAGEAVCATLDRRSLLRRRDPMRDVEQPIVANVDLVVVVCGLDRPVKPGKVQRSTALADDAGAEALVVLTKADQAEGDDDGEGAAAEVRAANPGVEVLLTSTVTGLGLDALLAACTDRTVVLIGESGAGKSSLANALSGTDVALVGAVRARDAKGRHTTTARELHLLPAGGVLIDTPGIRSIGLWTDAESVAAAFEDIEELAAGCRFSDCAHQGEPGCAVADAVADGRLAPARLEAWHALRAEADEAERRADDNARRAQDRRVARVPKPPAKRRRRR